VTHPLMSDVLADMEAIGFGKPEPVRWTVTITTAAVGGSLSTTTHHCTEKRSMDAVVRLLDELQINQESHGALMFVVTPA
jgi:hypothetical protein